MLNFNQSFYIAEPKNPDLFSDWRDYPYSLTDKLQAIKKECRLELLSQLWTKPNWWDKYGLEIKEDLIFERRILMKHEEKIYWYARTIIPQSCYETSPKLFQRLKNEPLKNLIFDNPKVHRVSLIHYPVNKECIEFHWVKEYLASEEDPVCLRLAHYALTKEASFYLAELLLPEVGTLA